MMYVPNAELDASSLLQGDIVKNVQFVGALHYGNIAYATPAAGGEPISWTVGKPPETGFAMVLSHSCEIARENGVKLTSIILAPLRDVSGATPADSVQKLIDSNLIDQSNPQASFLKYFYLEPHEELPFSTGAVVDFSKCFSIRKNSFDTILSSKLLELQAATRLSMSLKLALYFHRAEGATAA